LFDTKLSGFKIITISEQTEYSRWKMADMAEDGREESRKKIIFIIL